MYYLVYGLLYLFSLLPFFVLYIISDLVYVLVYYLVRYRRKVVSDNLTIAFPEKTQAERTQIEKQFYKSFVDTFIETIKLLSLSDAEFDRRCTGNLDEVHAITARGGNVMFLGMHQFNWEYVNLFIGRNVKVPLLGIYAKIENAAFNKIFYDLRAKYGTILIASSSFQRQMVVWLRKQHAMCLAGDQATNPTRAYWLNLFGHPTPFVIGPHKISAKNSPALVYIDMVKKKRGYYEVVATEIVTSPNVCTPETLALKYRDYIENMIRKNPANYLWSHRRWKHIYNETYSSQWIDPVPPGLRK